MHLVKGALMLWRSVWSVKPVPYRLRYTAPLDTSIGTATQTLSGQETTGTLLRDLSGLIRIAVAAASPAEFIVKIPGTVVSSHRAIACSTNGSPMRSTLTETR